jgi:hypothetical protein
MSNQNRLSILVLSVFLCIWSVTLSNACHIPRQSHSPSFVRRGIQILKLYITEFYSFPYWFFRNLHFNPITVFSKVLSHTVNINHQEKRVGLFHDLLLTFSESRREGAELYTKAEIAFKDWVGATYRYHVLRELQGYVTPAKEGSTERQ